MKRPKLAMVCLLFAVCVQAQTVDTLPSRDLLLSSIFQYHSALAATNAKQYTDNQRGAWLRFLPSIGISYVPTLNPDQPVAIRPSISFSSTNLLSFAQQRKVRKQSIIVIQETAQLDAAENVRQLEQLLANYEAYMAESKVHAELFAIEKQLFAIQQATYDKGDLPPSVFLAARKKLLVETLKMAQEARYLSERRTEILFIAHFKKQRDGI